MVKSSTVAPLSSIVPRTCVFAVSSHETVIVLPSARASETAESDSTSSSTPSGTRSTSTTSVASASVASRSPSIESSATSSPFRRIPTRSQTESTCPRMWLEKNTVAPRSRSASMISRISRAPVGSSPVEGSSRIRRSGSPTSAIPSTRRWVIPFE